MSPVEFLREGYSKVRRYYLGHFRKDYVDKMLQLRRGACRRCGNCCTVMFRCPHLEGDEHCAVYETRAVQCRLFPIDPRDLRGRFSACGHYFADATEAPPNEVEQSDVIHNATTSQEQRGPEGGGG